MACTGRQAVQGRLHENPELVKETARQRRTSLPLALRPFSSLSSALEKEAEDSETESAGGETNFSSLSSRFFDERSEEITPDEQELMNEYMEEPEETPEGTAPQASAEPCEASAPTCAVSVSAGEQVPEAKKRRGRPKKQVRVQHVKDLTAATSPHNANKAATDAYWEVRERDN